MFFSKDKAIENIKTAAVSRWVKFGIVGLIILAFVVWMSNPWLLLLLLLDFDIYISRILPWTWWQDIKNPSLRKFFEWVDAIVFALVAVYFINLYIFQNYKIPSSSLEKTLLVGDHLLVSKVAYGPRTPNTPFSFPLVQHTFPFFNCKSYIESIQWESRRLPGLGCVERNDIVVFNFPAGDSVAVNAQAQDYESLCYEAGLEVINSKGITLEEIEASGSSVRDFLLSLGREVVRQNKQVYGEIVYRPVDRRENYIKRCVGLPGDTLQIIDRELYINGKRQQRQPGVQYFCKVVSSNRLSQKDYDELEISNENSDRAYMGCDSVGDNIYLLPLTLDDQKAMRKIAGVKEVRELNVAEFTRGGGPTFPAGYNREWTVDNYGPIYIPARGATVAINKDNLPLYERIIRNYEGNKLEVRNGEVFINGKKADKYTFQMDYYWMMGDNRHNSADSRIWGYVPEDHIVGKPLFVWLSLNPDKGLFDGWIRWDRFFKSAGE